MLCRILRYHAVLLDLLYTYSVNSSGHQAVNTRKHQETPGNSRKHQETPGNTRTHQETRSYYYRYTESSIDRRSLYYLNVTV